MLNQPSDIWPVPESLRCAPLADKIHHHYILQLAQHPSGHTHTSASNESTPGRMLRKEGASQDVDAGALLASFATGTAQPPSLVRAIYRSVFWQLCLSTFWILIACEYWMAKTYAVPSTRKNRSSGSQQTLLASYPPYSLVH